MNPDHSYLMMEEEVLRSSNYYSFSSPVSDYNYNSNEEKDDSEGQHVKSRDLSPSDPFIDKVTDFTQKHKDMLDRLCTHDNHSSHSTTNTCGLMDTSKLLLINYNYNYYYNCRCNVWSFPSN